MWTWTNKVTESGWYAWKYDGLPVDYPTFISYFTVSEIGNEKFIDYFHMGNGKRQSFRDPLPFLVCPVTITPKQ